MSSYPKYFNTLLIGLVRWYQMGISPFWGPCCRFRPSCSEYTVKALQKFPLYRALWCSTKRILKCHPFHPGGEDPL